MPIGDIRDYPTAPVVTVESVTYFSHVISRVLSKDEPGKVWIKKEMRDPAIAKTENLAQEFFRLIIPHQPETRLAKDPSTGVHFILSEEVRGYRPLPENHTVDFANGHYTGLGPVVLVAMFLEEVDLKNGNLGLDDRGRVIKIDGDLCFGGGLEGKSFKLTPESIDSLPYPRDFYAHNWLDLIKAEVYHPWSKIVSPVLSNSPRFCSEINLSMFKICLLPDRFIDAFVDAYMPAGGERYVKLIKERRDELRLSSLSRSSFWEYVNSPQAAVYIESFIEQMRTFKANGKQIILSEGHEDLANEVRARAILLSNGKLLSDLHNKSFYKDHVLDGLINEFRVRMNNDSHDIAKLTVIKEEITTALGIISKCNELIEENLKRLDEIQSMYHSHPLQQAWQGGSELAIDKFIRESKARIMSVRLNESKILEIGKELLIPYASAIKCKPHISACYALMSGIYSFRAADSDPLLEAFLLEQEKALLKVNNDPAAFRTIEAELSKVLDAVGSPEGEEIKNIISRLRIEGKARLTFTFGKTDKAARIERALCETPLMERKYVYTQAGLPNAVQKAVASHRYGLSKGVVYYKKDKDGNMIIDESKLGLTAKDLKTKLSAAREAHAPDKKPSAGLTKD